LSLLAGGCAASPDADPVPDPGCQEPTRTFRIDGVDSPADARVGVDLDGDGAVDDRAGDLIRTLFATYAEHGVVASWREQLAQRLADRTAWTIDVPGCQAAPTTAAEVPLGALADLTGAVADDGWHPVAPLALQVSVDGDELTAVIAGGLLDGYQAVIATSLLPFLDGIHTAWTATLDTDGDGAIELEELLSNPAFQLFVAPDLEGGSLSFGLSVHATAI
jgi:hypothetical protein